MYLTQSPREGEVFQMIHYTVTLAVYQFLYFIIILFITDNDQLLSYILNIRCVLCLLKYKSMIRWFTCSHGSWYIFKVDSGFQLREHSNFPTFQIVLFTISIYIPRGHAKADGTTLHQEFINLNLRSSVNESFLPCKFMLGIRAFVLSFPIVKYVY